MITKDGRDTPIEKLTPELYIVPKGEELSYHAVIEVVQYDPKTGKKLSRPRVQKFGKKMFETSVMASLRKQGYTVTILHDPNTWIKEQQGKAAKAKADEIAAKKAAEKAKFDAAVDAAVSERLDAAVATAVAKALADAKAEPAKTKDPDPNEGAATEAKKPGRPAKETKD